MNTYHPRWTAPLLKTMIKEAPIVVLTGPRQVGKSTLLRNELADHFKLFDLDDLDLLEQIKRDPNPFLSISDYLIFDEAQRAPELLVSIKKLVDTHPEKRIILSGSANLLLMSKVTDSLAGRAQFLHLAPMTVAELNTRKPPLWLEYLLLHGRFKPEQILNNSKTHAWNTSRIWQGGMPVTLQRQKPDSLVRWREGYIESYLERDLRQLSQIDSLTDFRRLMKLAALRNGQILNQSEIARDAAISQPTTHRYLSLLETSEWTYSLPPFLSNKSVQVMKRPKIHWFDTGIAAHLQSWYDTKVLLESRELGALLETFAVNQIRPLCGLLTPKAELFFWRLRDGTEVDLVIQRGSTIIALEIKSSLKARYQDIRGLQKFITLHERCSCGLLLYSGTKVEKMTDKIWAIPITALF